MSALTLVLRDLYPARLDHEVGRALPRLRALERWLARGHASVHAGDWRGWLLRASGPATPLAPPASVAAAALEGIAPDCIVWLATPVHRVVGLDTVRLHPAGLVELDAGEQRSLCTDFDRVFAGSGARLHATGRRELLLSGGQGLREAIARSDDPAQWLGADPSAAYAAGEAAARRRLAAELEMWLHEHPINRARARRGQLEANGLWLWGGGATPLAAGVPAVPATPAAPAMTAFGADLFVDGLLRLRGGRLAPAGDRLPPALPAGDALVVCGLGAAPDAASLLELERAWIEPALVSWQRGALRQLTLLAGHRAVMLDSRSRWRAWRALRRSRPWWDTLLQC